MVAARKTHGECGYASTFHGNRTSTTGGLKKGDIEKVVNKDGSVRYVGKRKRAVAKANYKTNTFMLAARKLGYMTPGGPFKPLPKKGTSAYLAIKAQQLLM